MVASLLFLLACGEQATNTLPEDMCLKYEYYGGNSTWASDEDHYVPCVDVQITVSAVVDGAVIDPVALTINVQTPDAVSTDPEAYDHYDADEIADETPIASGLTGEPISMRIAQGETWSMAAWVGDANTTSSDGFSILEHNERHWLHPAALIDVSEDSRNAQTVELNVMPAVENTNYYCTADQTWTASGEPAGDGHHEFVQQFVAKEGKYFMDPDEIGFDGLFGTNESLMTNGTTLAMHNTTSGDYALDEGTEVMQNGFTVMLDNSALTTHLACVKQ